MLRARRHLDMLVLVVIDIQGRILPDVSVWYGKRCTATLATSFRLALLQAGKLCAMVCAWGKFVFVEDELCSVWSS